MTLGANTPQSSYKRQFFRGRIKSSLLLIFWRANAFWTVTPAGKVKPAQLRTSFWRAGMSPHCHAGRGWHYPHHQDLHSTFLSGSSWGNHWTWNTLANPSAASSERSTCEILGAKWPKGTLLPLCEIPWSFPTLKQHVLGFGFWKSAVTYHISVWHQLEDNRLTLSVEKHTIGTHAILTQLPVGFIFKSSWRHANTIYMPNHQLCVDKSRSSRILFTLSTMVHTSAMAPRPAG